MLNLIFSAIALSIFEALFYQKPSPFQSFFLKFLIYAYLHLKFLFKKCQFITLISKFPCLVLFPSSKNLYYFFFAFLNYLFLFFLLFFDFSRIKN